MAKFLDSAGLTYLWGKIQQSINEQIAVNVRLEVVQALPASGEGNIIYLVPGQTTATSNIYDEYIWTGTPGAWEKIGTTATDLANYYTKNQIDSKLGTLASGYNDFASWISAINTSLGNLSTIVGNGSGISGADLTASIVALESLVGSFTGDGTHTTIGSAVDYLLDEIDGEFGIKNDINTINSAIGDVNSGLVKDVDDLLVSVSNLESAVDNLETTVGDSNSGLVADVATNTSDISNLQTDLSTLVGTVGDSTGGLVKDVEDLQTAVGDADGGLVKDVADNASAISSLETTIGDPDDTSSDSTVYGAIADLRDNVESAIGTSSDVPGASTVYGAINSVDEKIGDPSDTTSDDTVYGAIAGKANASHTHVCADITDLGALTNAEIDTAIDAYVPSGN